LFSQYSKNEHQSLIPDGSILRVVPHTISNSAQTFFRFVLLTCSCILYIQLGGDAFFSWRRKPEDEVCFEQTTSGKKPTK